MVTPDAYDTDRNRPYWAAQIRRFRLMRKLKQSDLARLVNKSRSAVAAWESGRNRPDLETLSTLCRIFGCRMEQLIGNPIESDAVSETGREPHKEETLVSSGETAKGHHTRQEFHMPPDLPPEAREEYQLLLDFLRAKYRSADRKSEDSHK
ncbi:MAG: helix-turn-helix domain-containing protein [Limnochordales bacterium]|nr:helix-turn-helix domain-containing protein [Limnochordales bacterium]